MVPNVTEVFDLMSGFRTIYVTFEKAHYDGSGEAQVHGVYSTLEKAEACAGRVLMDQQGSGRVSVIPFPLDDLGTS